MSKSYRKAPCWCNAHPKNPFKTKQYLNKLRRQRLKHFVDEEGIPDMPNHAGVAWPLGGKESGGNYAFFTICSHTEYDFTGPYISYKVPCSRELFSRRTEYKIPKCLSKEAIRYIRRLKFK